MPEPEQNPEQDTTGLLSGAAGERWKSWFRFTFVGFLAMLLIGHIFLYSLHRALTARVENQERRIERLQGVVDDLLIASDSAEKIEKIEQQVNGIDGQLGDLTETLKAQASDTDGTPPVEAPKKSRKKG